MDQPDHPTEEPTTLDLPGTEPIAPPTTGEKFIDWLAQHRGGLLDVDFADAFIEVVRAVQTTGKPGEVTLTIKVEPTKGEMLAITDKIKAKAPETAQSKLYWVDFDGSLTRDNPQQPKLLIPPSSTEGPETRP